MLDVVYDPDNLKSLEENINYWPKSSRKIWIVIIEEVRVLGQYLRGVPNLDGVQRSTGERLGEKKQQNWAFKDE